MLQPHGRLSDPVQRCPDHVFQGLLTSMLRLQLEESQDWDGVIGRDFLKHRAAKLLAAAARQREREHDSAAGAG